MLEGLDKIPEDKLFNYFLFFWAIILPGFGIIFFFFRALFFDLDLLRIVLLSLFYSMPILLISFLVSINFIRKKSELKFPLVIFIMSSFAICGFIISLTIVKIMNFLLFFKNPLVVLYLLCIVVIYLSPRMFVNVLKQPR